MGNSAKLCKRPLRQYNKISKLSFVFDFFGTNGEYGILYGMKNDGGHFYESDTGLVIINILKNGTFYRNELVK
jgi:hypothetical protein